MELKEALAKLYGIYSKHSHYQNIPAFVSKELGYEERIDETWRGDSSRWKFLQTTFPFTKISSLADVGANTGFFALNIARDFPGIAVTSYEQNPDHVRFMEIVADHFRLPNLIVNSNALDISAIESMPKVDAMLLMNVLHHAGVDFDQAMVHGPDHFAQYANEYLARLSRKVDLLVLQLGYSWGGNRLTPIANREDPVAMIRLLSSILDPAWAIQSVAFCKSAGSNREYEALSLNLLRNDVALKEHFSKLNIANLSEFYRRPIVIAKSKWGQP